MKINLDVTEIGISVGVAVDKVLVDPQSQENVVMPQPFHRAAAAVNEHSSLQDYYDAVIAVAMAAGFTEAVAISIATMAITTADTSLLASN